MTPCFSRNRKWNLLLREDLQSLYSCIYTSTVPWRSTRESVRNIKINKTDLKHNTFFTEENISVLSLECAPHNHFSCDALQCIVISRRSVNNLYTAQWISDLHLVIVRWFRPGRTQHLTKLDTLIGKCILTWTLLVTALKKSADISENGYIAQRCICFTNIRRGPWLHGAPSDRLPRLLVKSPLVLHTKYLCWFCM